MLMELPDKWGECSRTVPLEGFPRGFAHWGDMIAVGVNSDVVFLDTITGIRTSVLSSNTGTITSLGFSHDGTLLVSKGHHDPIKLWDVQTGGVIRTFTCHTVGSVASISPDGSTIALGTDSGTIHLWDVRTGKHHSIEMGQDHSAKHIRFSPVDSQHFISLSSNGTIQQWNVAGQQIGAFYKGGGEDLAYASDGTRFASCGEGYATVRDSESGAVVVEIEAPVRGLTCRCCFSPDGRFVALSVDRAIYVWDITIPGARLVGCLAGHTNIIRSLAFPTLLISTSADNSMRFWQSSSFLADESKSTDHITALQGSTRVMSVNLSISLFPRGGTVVTSDESGVVKTWDLITGRCKSSFSTPAKGPRDTYSGGGALILVWWEGEEREYHIWNVGKGRLLQRFRSSFQRVEDLKISGDESKILGVYDRQVEVVSMQTGEITSHLEVTSGWQGPLRLCVRGSKIGVDNWCRRGWDIKGGIASGFRDFPNQFRLDLADPSPRPGGSVEKSTTRWIVDTVTGRRVFHLPERYINPSTEISRDGHHLLIWSPSGVVVVVDFDHVVQSPPTAFSTAFSRLANLL